MFSLYTSLYNLKNGFIDWKGALENFEDFAEEVCVATTSMSEPFGYDAKTLREYAVLHPRVKIIVTDFSFDDLAFDGKLKNAALSICKEPFCILLDGDERVDVRHRVNWETIARTIEKDNKWDAAFIPVVDLFNTDREYKSIGQKWYLHKNLPNLNRGIVNFAKKENNKIDIKRSDTCELIYDDNSLVRSWCMNVTQPDLEYIKFIGCCVWHLGWLDKEKRLKSNNFWQKVWDNRAGFEVKNIIHSKEKLDKIEYWPHGLKLWYE